MNIKDVYRWEIELVCGSIITDHNNFDPKNVVRISYISEIFPRHDLIFQDFKFIKRFVRCSMKWDSFIKEFLHVTITDRFRFYLKSSDSGTLITPKNYELYL